MCRPARKTERLFPAMSNAELLPVWFPKGESARLFDIFTHHGEGLRFVGGCVRDGLMGLPLGDLDAATTALPGTIVRILSEAGIQAVPTGIEHGTVTAVFPSQTIEITTLRMDDVCDGRHAKVSYTDDWAADAARRDFTINALYLDQHGTIHDYFGGKKDLKSGTIRFIGDADMRIQEDYLRVLRFFRFLASHSHAPADSGAMEACSRARDKLGGLSGERIQKEMLKLLSVKNPVYALQCMEETGVLTSLTGSHGGLNAVSKLMELETQTGLPPHAILRLSLFLKEEAARGIAERWRLSKKDAELLQTLVAHPPIAGPKPYKELKKAIRVLGKLPASLLLLRDGIKTTLPKDTLLAALKLCQTWDIPVFPVTGEDLMQRGMKQGKALGDTLKQLEQRWEDSDYTLTKDSLLKLL